MFQREFNRIMNIITSEGSVWRMIRFLLVVFVILGMVFWSASLFTRPEKFPWVLVTWSGLRFWIFPILGFLVALLLAGRYVCELYELPRLGYGVRYILSVLFGFSLPSWRIVNGDWEVVPDQFNMLRQVGGPGWLNIQPGNLVLLETPSGPSNVLASGYYFISRRETIKEIINLSDQHGHIPERRARTKDGIEVIVRDIRYHYRLWPSRRRGEYIPRSPEDPYPYTMQAVRNLVYNRNVSSQGLTSIPMAMDFIVDGAITDFVYSHQFDFVTAPQSGVDSRGQIRDAYRGAQIQERLRGLGMELMWVDIGHFDVSDETWEQRVRTWGSRWEGTAEIEQALGESRRNAYHRLARAEGRADALRNMIQALDSAQRQGLPPVNLRNLLLLYTAQILEEMGGRNEGRSRQDQQRRSFPSPDTNQAEQSG